MSARIHLQLLPRLRTLAREHPRLRRLRELLKSRHRLREEQAQRLVDEIVFHVVDEFADRCVGQTTGRLHRIAEIRETLHSFIDHVVEGRHPPEDFTPERLNHLLDELRGEMRNLLTPEEQARSARALDPDIPDRLLSDFHDTPDPNARSREGQGRFRGSETDVREYVDRLSTADSDLLRRAITDAPAELRLVVFSEEAGSLRQGDPPRPHSEALRQSLRGSEWSEAEINRAVDVAEAISYRRALAERVADGAEHGTRVDGAEHRTRVEGAEHRTRVEGAARLREVFDAVAARRRAEGNPLVTSIEAIERAINGDRLLELILHDSPESLIDFHNEFASGGSNSKNFRAYVRQRMVTHVKGMVGEFTAAFALGERVTLLKGPDYQVTIPGTDLVGVLANGELWLLDNKAVSDSTLASVSSLTRNLPENLAKDSAEFRAALDQLRTQGREVDPNIEAAVRRLDEATAAIREFTAHLTPEQVAHPDIQAKIKAELDSRQIRRVVSNAGGEITGLAEGLDNVGVRLENVNKPPQ